MTAEKVTAMPGQLSTAPVRARADEAIGRMALALTVVAPSRNEEESVGPLAQAVRAVMGDERYELLFVDDSDDRTPAVLAELARDPGLHVRYLHRPPDAGRWGGLAGAVVDGIRHSAAEY